ncbi:MAG: hypothetical protein ACRDLD_03165, partial [Thermoleophilaceae bacterium]
ADSEAEEARARSTAEAAERLDLVHAASARVLERAEEIERALGELRDEAMALGVEVGVDAPAGAGTDEEVEPTELVPADAVEPTSDPVPQTVESEAEDLEAEVDEATPEATDTDEPVAEDGGADVEDVRLVALNMALNGSPRDETARYLEENFAIEDPTALLDEVYERAGA